MGVMADPKRRDIAEERREQIVSGALKVFSTKGFVRATNRDVAEAAGIGSPGLIYHYFKDKADLLRAVVERHAPPLQLALHPEELMALPPREGLTRFGRAYLDLIDEPNLGAAMRVILGEALREPAFARLFGQAVPLRVWKLLTAYLKRQMDAGALRAADPAHAALTFVGPLVAFLLMHRVFEFPEAQAENREALLATVVDIFLHGMEPAKEAEP